MNKGMVVLAFAAGLLGGVAGRYFQPVSVHAQSLPREVRAQSFVLVDDRGAVLGTFSAEAGGSTLKLFDTQGREIWSAGGAAALHARQHSFAVAGR